jgi:cysteine synthase
MDASLTRNRIEAARQIAGQTGAFWTDQLNNTDQLTAYHTLADEIWVQTGGRIDAFVQSAGTAACVRGVAEGLRRRKPDIRIVAVEPLESAVLSGGKSGVHKIEGVGAGFVVPLWNPSIANEIATVSTEAAIGDGASAGALGGACSLGLQPARTSPPRLRSACGSARPRRSSPSFATPASST